MIALCKAAVKRIATILWKIPIKNGADASLNASAPQKIKYLFFILRIRRRGSIARVIFILRRFLFVRSNRLTERKLDTAGPGR